MQLASLGMRLAASTLDLALLSLVHGAVLAYAFLAHPPLPEAVSHPGLILLFDALLLLAYGALELSPRGTLGKRLLRLRLYDVSGRPAPRPSLFRRWLIKFPPITGGVTASLALILSAFTEGEPPTLLLASRLSGLLFLLSVFDALFVLGTLRRALHDRLSDTLVVDARPA